MRRSAHNPLSLIPSIPHLVLYPIVSLLFPFSLPYSLHLFSCFSIPSHSARIVPLHFQARCQHILSVYTKKIAGGQGSAPDPAGGSHHAPPDPKWELDPLTARIVRFAPSVLVPDCGAQIMVTLAYNQTLPPPSVFVRI